jgi:hypothetical protein
MQIFRSRRVFAAHETASSRRGAKRRQAAALQKLYKTLHTANRLFTAGATKAAYKSAQYKSGPMEPSVGLTKN